MRLLLRKIVRSNELRWTNQPFFNFLLFYFEIQTYNTEIQSFKTQYETT